MYCHVIDFLLYVRFLCTLQSKINFQHSTLSHPMQRHSRLVLNFGDVLIYYHVMIFSFMYVFCVHRSQKSISSTAHYPILCNGIAVWF